MWLHAPRMCADGKCAVMSQTKTQPTDAGVVGFLVRNKSDSKAAHATYTVPSYTDFGRILSWIGKHKTGKSCLYVNTLADIDLEVLAEFITAGLEDLSSRWPVLPT